MIIAIDFDGTITSQSDFPIMGELREGCKEAIEYAQKLGHTCVLWTCRKGCFLEEAIEQLKFWGIELEVPYKEDGKLIADVYIDDRSYGIDKIDWYEIKDWLILNA